MAMVHPGATLTPHFLDFLPAWLARQPWYITSGTLSLSPVGYFRFEDPAGAVGVETHLLTDGAVVYQIPMTYRDAPIDGTPGGRPGADRLIAIAEHSVLGTRWIYDAVDDPVWVNEMLRLVRTEGVSGPSGRRGVAPAQARGHRLTTRDVPAGADIELIRVIVAGAQPEGAGVIGVVLGSWSPGGAGVLSVDGCLAVLRDRHVPYGLDLA